MSTEQMGEEGFRWFIGVVEDIAGDPKKLGRVKVRILNEHDEGVETGDTEWCQMLMPNTSEGVDGIGDTPGLAVGSRVVGFFVDGQEKQIAMILGSFATIPDGDENRHGVSWLARGKQILAKQLIGPEPPSAYKAEYPYNRVISTKSGHVIELDDTPNAERIHIYHKSGAYIEIDPNGQLTIKSPVDRFDIVGGKHEVYVKGNANVQVDGTCDIHANKAASISSDVGLKLKAPGGVTVVGGSLTVEKSMATVSGATGTFTSATGQKINVQNGIVTSIG